MALKGFKMAPSGTQDASTWRPNALRWLLVGAKYIQHGSKMLKIGSSWSQDVPSSRQNVLRRSPSHSTVHAYMCTHTCVRIHVHAYMCTHTWLRIHVCAYMCTQMGLGKNALLCCVLYDDQKSDEIMCVRMHVCAYMCTHACARIICLRIHVYATCLRIHVFCYVDAPLTQILIV